MTLTLIGWILILSALAISTLLISPSRSASPDLLSRLRSSSSGIGQGFRESAGTLSVAATSFLLVAGAGAVISYMEAPPELSRSGDPSASEADSEIAELGHYARSIGAEQPAPKAADANLLPDVNTMIERLAARLETSPNDVNGWRMLGWSYFNMERFEAAAAAYAKAAALDPSSSELKRAYEHARAKASESGTLQTGAIGKGAGGPGAGKVAETQAAPPHMGNAQIRSMVDGLAARLEGSPRDVEGWARLMRSRVVLGERESAATAFQKALDVFKDDSAASATITAAAIELRLKTE